MATIKEELLEYLANEGLRPHSEEFGISFRFNMMNFIIRWDEDDDHFISVALPGIFRTDENNRFDALIACNSLNMERKVIKGIVADDSVWIVAEMLLDETPVYEDIIPRALGMLVQGRDCFYENLNSL